MSIGHILEKELRKKRYCCAHCGYTWIEYVGLIIEKRKESDDIHFRIGYGTPSECLECGCDLIYETVLPEENQQKETSFEGIKRIIRERVEI